MFVFRWTQQAKVRCKNKVVTLFKEGAATMPEQTSRIYTYDFGPVRTVVWEAENESIEEHARSMDKFWASPFGLSFNERLAPLVEASGIREQLTLEHSQ